MTKMKGGGGADNANFQGNKRGYRVLRMGLLTEVLPMSLLRFGGPE